VRFRFLTDGDARTSALQTLSHVAKEPSPPHSGEMLGEALEISYRSEEALQAYLRDVATPGASHARKRAVDLAYQQRETEILGQLCADERVLADMNSVMKWKVAKLTGNRRLLFQGLWQMQWMYWIQGAAVPIALFAAAIWYIILVHTASRETMRWWRYLAAVFGGIASVWVLHWWQGTLQYSDGDPGDAPTMTHEMLQWIMHVGLPEEAAKLLCFAFFLPVLLHHRSGVKAALTAGCVGLGFALDENLHYFLKPDAGISAALGRLLMANFVHISLTGIIGWHLYELFRSRFNHATEFLVAFCGVVVAHGIYDFAFGPSAQEWGFGIAVFIVVGVAAKIYLPMLHDSEGRSQSGVISRTAVFCLGTAVLGGMVMIVMVWQMESLRGITEVLRSIASLALVGLIYIQEWRELH
jgi:RsiW-degrading membrane proteinase PrsW (M82 family)